MEKEALRKIHEIERARMLPWTGPKYYDYPDGEDLMGKLSFTTKVVGFLSLAYGIIHANSYPPSPRPAVRLMRICKIVAPCIGMAVTFTCVTYYSTILRKKDDPINYALGGAAAGLFLGPMTGIPIWSGWGAFYLSMVAAAQKQAKMKGSSLIHYKPLLCHNSYVWKRIDTSWAPEIKGNWTK